LLKWGPFFPSTDITTRLVSICFEYMTNSIWLLQCLLQYIGSAHILFYILVFKCSSMLLLYYTSLCRYHDLYYWFTKWVVTL